MELEKTCAITNLEDEFINTHLSSEQIQKIASPILKKCFSEVHYNRLNQVCKFIDFYYPINQQFFPKVTATPDLQRTMKTTKGGSSYEFRQ